MVYLHTYIIVLITAGFALLGLSYGYRSHREESSTEVGCDPLMTLLPVGAAICDARLCLRQANEKFVELFWPGADRGMTLQRAGYWLEGIQSLKPLLERAQSGKCQASGNLLFRSGVYCFVTVYWMPVSASLSITCQPMNPPREMAEMYAPSVEWDINPDIWEQRDELSWKDRQIERIAHELSDPLNAMLGWLHLLEAKKIPVEEVLPAIRRIQNDARRQSGLIDELRKLARPSV